MRPLPNSTRSYFGTTMMPLWPFSVFHLKWGWALCGLVRDQTCLIIHFHGKPIDFSERSAMVNLARNMSVSLRDLFFGVQNVFGFFARPTCFVQEYLNTDCAMCRFGSIRGDYAILSHGWWPSNRRSIHASVYWGARAKIERVF